MTFTYRSEFASSIRYYNNFDLFVFSSFFCRMQQFRPHLSTYLKSVNTFVDTFHSIHNKSTSLNSLKIYNSCGLSAMNILYLCVVSVASGVRMFSPNSACLPTIIRSHVVVYAKKNSLSDICRALTTLCVRGISQKSRSCPCTSMRKVHVACMVPCQWSTCVTWHHLRRHRQHLRGGEESRGGDVTPRGATTAATAGAM